MCTNLTFDVHQARTIQISIKIHCGKRPKIRLLEKYLNTATFYQPRGSANDR